MQKSCETPASTLAGQSIPILTYHSLDDSGSVISTPPHVFRQQMRCLWEQQIYTLSVADVGRLLLAQQPLPAQALAITFDDGLQNTYEHAFPVLQQYGLTATIFLTTDYCGQYNTWPSQAPHMPRLPLLQWPQIVEMHHAGLDFGVHTRSHPDLTTLSLAQVEDEIGAAKQTLEAQLQRPVVDFAYPYGRYNAAVKGVVQRLFEVACGTRLGFVHAGSDRFALERLDMYYLRKTAVFRRLFTPLGRAYIGWRGVLREVRRHAALLLPTM